MIQRLCVLAAERAGQLAALILFTAMAPVVTALLVLGRHRQVRLRRWRRLGRAGSEYEELGLELGSLGWPALGALGVRRWPALLSVIRMDMALVGPRARSVGEIDVTDARHAAVLSVRPGLVCSWWVQRRRLIDYTTELETDLTYVSARGPATDLGVLARAAIAWVGGGSAPVTAEQSRILGVSIDALSMDTAVQRIADLVSTRRTSQVCFVNADCLNLACRDGEYKEALAAARLTLPDGSGVILASRLTGRPLRQNVNGTDMFPRLCDRLALDRRRIFLLGAKPGVAEKVKAYVEERHPGLSVVGARSGFFSPAEERSVIDQIRGSNADVVLVGFGAPRQDVWIRRHLRELGAPVAIGVGGLFDFYSFTVPRAPLWVRELGMEWAFRLIIEPRRLWKRYLIGNGAFLMRVALDAAHLVDYGTHDGARDRETFPQDGSAVPAA